MRHTLLLAAAIMLGLAGLTTNANAFSFTSTALSKSFAEHDLAIVARISKQAEGVKAEPLKLIKGELPSAPIKLADTWRPGTEALWGPLTLEPGKTYFLMLHKEAKGRYALSRDSSSRAVTEVESADDAFARAAQLLFRVSTMDDAAEREARLLRIGRDEHADVRRLISRDLAGGKAEAAAIPYLLAEMQRADVDQGAAANAANAIKRQKYKQAVPGLLEILRKREGAVSEAMEVLSAFKEKEAFDPLAKIVESPSDGHELDKAVFALWAIGDERAVPLLIREMTRGVEQLDPSYGQHAVVSWDANEWAASALAELRSPEAMKALMDVVTMKHGRSDLRNRALDSIGYYGAAAKEYADEIRTLRDAGKVATDVAERTLAGIEKE